MQGAPQKADAARQECPDEQEAGHSHDGPAVAVAPAANSGPCTAGPAQAPAVGCTTLLTRGASQRKHSPRLTCHDGGALWRFGEAGHLESAAAGTTHKRRDWLFYILAGQALDDSEGTEEEEIKAAGRKPSVWVGHPSCSCGALADADAWHTSDKNRTGQSDGQFGTPFNAARNVWPQRSSSQHGQYNRPCTVHRHPCQNHPSPSTLPAILCTWAETRLRSGARRGLEGGLA